MKKMKTFEIILSNGNPKAFIADLYDAVEGSGVEVTFQSFRNMDSVRIKAAENYPVYIESVIEKYVSTKAANDFHNLFD